MEVSIDNAAYRTTCPALTRTSDFFSFWDETLNELDKVAIDYRVKQTRNLPDGLTEEWIEFDSLHNIAVTAYTLFWNDDRPRPLLVYTHGYEGQCEVMLDWARHGINVIGVDLRGMGRSQASVSALSPQGYILTGIESAQQSILRGAVCDFIRAGEIARQLLSVEPSRTIFHGHSFGGAISLMAAALTHMPDLLISAVPTLGWTEGRLQLVRRGSGLEIKNYLEKDSTRRAGLMQVLSYFDTMNFADRVKCPTLLGVGQRDDIVPAETVYAISNHLACPLAIREFPVSHSDSPDESLWAHYETEWLRLAVEGVTEGFGQGEGQFRSYPAQPDPLNSGS